MAEVQVTVEDFYTAIGKLFFALSNEEKKVLDLQNRFSGMSKLADEMNNDLTNKTRDLITAKAVNEELRRDIEKMREELAVPRSRKK